jgi:hypothetical protein
VKPRAAWHLTCPRARVTSGGSGSVSLPGIHSLFAFYELAVFGDQPLAGSLRLRLSGMGRAEVHSDGAEDSRSLYFSLDVRRLF